MMKKLMERMKMTAAQELKMASKDYGETFASDHEAYAVIKEELEEAVEEVEGAKEELEEVWKRVKGNADKESLKIALDKLYNRALHGACELVQVMAMAEKATRMPLKRDDEKRG